MIINGNEIKAVIFDMDGTLIDTEKYLTRFWCQAAEEAGFSMKPEQAYMLRSLQGKYASIKLRELFGNKFDYESVRKRRRELMNEHLSVMGIEPKPYLKASLERIRQSGYMLAVATSTDEVRTEQYLNEVGVLALFDSIVCADMVENGKPMPDIYEYACKKIGYKPQNCIAVEDSENGVLSAYRAGTNVILIPDLTKETEAERRMTYKIVPDLEKLADFFEMQSKNC